MSGSFDINGLRAAGGAPGGSAFDAPALVPPGSATLDEAEERKRYYIEKYGEEAQRRWEESDKTVHATVSRLNEEYKVGGERNMEPPVESAYTGTAGCFEGVDPYAMLEDGGR